MKKITTLLLSLTVAATMFAQTAEDALNLAQEYYEGTARSMALGNAFTALGGDLGGLAINPAASGVFRCSQITFTPGLTTARSSANYLGNTATARNTSLTVSTLGTVLTFDTGNYSGLLNFNFGFVYNKKNSFRSAMKAYGTTDNSSMLSSIAAGLEGVSDSILEENNFNNGIPWTGQLAWNSYVLAPLSVLGGKYSDVHDSYIASTENYNEATDQLQIGGKLDQAFNRKVRGSNEVYALNFGGNFSDFLYFGVNVNLHTVSQTVEEYYEEVAQDASRFDDGFVSMDNSFWLHTTGTGANFKFGVILNPMSGLRLGATFTTPTWYSLTDEWDYTMNTAFNNGNSYTEYSPTGTYSYKVTAPMRWSVGAAFTFMDRGLISVDYENVNYAGTRLKSENGSESVFFEENNWMSQNFLASSTVRAGLELRLTDAFSLRGGYQYYTPSAKGYASRNVVSAGVGFNFSPTTSIDLAWSRMMASTDTFQLYDDYSSAVTVPTGTNTHSLSKVVCTLALKF